MKNCRPRRLATWRTSASTWPGRCSIRDTTRHRQRISPGSPATKVCDGCLRDSCPSAPRPTSAGSAQLAAPTRDSTDGLREYGKDDAAWRLVVQFWMRATPAHRMAWLEEAAVRLAHGTSSTTPMRSRCGRRRRLTLARTYHSGEGRCSGLEAVLPRARRVPAWR